MQVGLESVAVGVGPVLEISWALGGGVMVAVGGGLEITVGGVVIAGGGVGVFGMRVVEMSLVALEVVWLAVP